MTRCSDCGSTSMPTNVARYGSRCIRCWVRWMQWHFPALLVAVVAASKVEEPAP